MPGKRTLLIALMLLFLTSLWADIPVPEPGASFRIARIKIEGAKRSKDKFILSVIEIEEGDSWYPGLEEDVQQELLAEGVFRRETLSVTGKDSDEGRILRIYVEDRWTLIPVPVVSVSSDSWMAGLMLMEQNFLGRGIFATSGFIYGSDMMNIILILGFDNLFFGGGFMKTDHEELTISGGEERTLRTYKMSSPYAFIRPKIEIGNWEIGWDFQYTGAYPNDVLPDPDVRDVEGGNYFITGPAFKYENLRYKSIFASGPRANGTLNYITQSYVSLVGNASWGILAGRSTFFSLSGGGGWGLLPDSMLFQLGGNKRGSRTLPTGMTGTAYAHGTVEIEQVLFPLGSSTFTAYLYYEGGFFRDLLERNVPYHGPGVGLSLHLDKVAIPAFGVSVAWSVPLAQPYISLAFGMGF